MPPHPSLSRQLPLEGKPDSRQKAAPPQKSRKKDNWCKKSAHECVKKLIELYCIAPFANAMIPDSRNERNTCAASGTQKGRKPKLNKQVEEDLIAENQRLRMEIDYLKKLNALVLEEERQNRKHK